MSTLGTYIVSVFCVISRNIKKQHTWLGFGALELPWGGCIGIATIVNIVEAAITKRMSFIVVV